MSTNNIRVIVGDCRKVMATMPDNSVDSIVTNPPYELGFMGKSWDSTGKAAILEGFRFVGIEQSAEYADIARARIGVAINLLTTT